jgi:hypothetical protein
VHSWQRRDATGILSGVVSLKYALTKDEFVRIVRYLTLRDERVLIRMLAIVVSALLVHTIAGLVSFGVALSTGLFLALVDSVFFFLFRPSRAWRQSPRIRFEQTLAISDNGIELQRPGVKSQTEWRFWGYVKALPAAYLLGMEDQTWSIAIPKRAFQSSNDEAVFRDLAQRHLPPPAPTRARRTLRLAAAIAVFGISVALAALTNPTAHQTLATLTTISRPETPAARAFALAQIIESDLVTGQQGTEQLAQGLLSIASYEGMHRTAKQLSGLAQESTHHGKRLYTGCAQQSMTRLRCFVAYSTPAKVGPSARGDKWTYATLQANGDIEFSSNSNPALGFNSGTVSHSELKSWVNADQSPAEGHKAGNLTFYYATVTTLDQVCPRLAWAC